MGRDEGALCAADETGAADADTDKFPLHAPARQHIDIGIDGFL